MIAPRWRVLTKELIMRVEAFTISYIYDDIVFHSISIIKVQAFRCKVDPFESNTWTFSESPSHFCEEFRANNVRLFKRIQFTPETYRTDNLILDLF